MTEHKNIELPNNSKSKKEFSKNIIIAILSVCLLLAVCYILYINKTYAKSTIELQANVNDLERSREILKQELRIIRADFDNAKSKLTKKDITLDNQNKLILSKQEQIQSLLLKEKITKNELEGAKRLMVSLQSDIIYYKEEIARLKNDNKTLSRRNSELTTENDSLADQKKIIKSSLDKANKSKQDLEEEINSTLSISNYDIKGLMIRSNGKEVETNKARRIDKVRVTFDLDKNLKSPSDKKELFITIYKPNGDIGKFKGATTGQITLRSGENINYSDRVLVNYNNMSGTRVSFDWVDYEFPEGNYKIDIYQNGYKVGQNIITLK